jgi:hypothetical protein
MALAPALGEEHLRAYGHEEGFTLAHSVPEIVRHDPEFVRDIYVALFRHREESDKVSPMGTSRILRLTSTYRQDYAMAQHVLSRQFARFLETAPTFATEALILCTAAYIEQRHPYRRWDRFPGGSFQLLEVHAEVNPDGSAMWDAGDLYQHDAAFEMAATFVAWLKEQTAPLLPSVHDALKTFARLNKTAFLWRRVLSAATVAPWHVSSVLRELAWAKPLMEAIDTTHQYADCVHAIYPRLESEERKRVESVVMGIDTADDEGQYRDQMLARLSPDLIESDEARNRVQETRSMQIPPLEPPVRIDSGAWLDNESDVWLREEGVETDKPENRRILDLTRELNESAQPSEGANDAVKLTEATSEASEKLYAALLKVSSVDSMVARNGWGALSSLWVRILGFPSCPEPVALALRERVLELATNPDPTPSLDQDSRFDKMPGWSSPAPRVDAAQGLMLLGRFPNAVNEDLRLAIDKLSRDPVPSVRLQIADRVWLLNKTAQSDMWALVTRIAEEDQSAGVVGFLVNDSLGRLASLDSQRVMLLAERVLQRFNNGPGVSELRERCFDILTAWHLWRNEPSARRIIESVAGVRPLVIADSSAICSNLRDVLVVEPDAAHPDADGARARAVSLLGSLVQGVTTEYAAWEARAQQNALLTESDMERVRELVGFIDLAAREVYFASGVFQARTSAEDARQISTFQRVRLVQEASGILGRLADTGLAPVAHHLLELLESVVDQVPRQAFALIGRTLLAGERGGYQFEAVAEPLFVRLVERYLSDHREIFVREKDLQTMLLRMLDVFVKAGWPSAQRLTYRLDEIFR